MIAVTLPIVTLTNEDDTGEVPYLTDIDWYRSTDVKMNVEDREGAHGAYDEDPIFDAPRYLTILGRMICSDRLTRLMFRDSLLSLKRIAGRWPVTVTDELGTRTLFVRIAGAIEFDDFETDGYADFEIPVFSKDSFTYGPEQVVTTGPPQPGGGLVFPIVYPIQFGAPGDPGRAVTTNSGTADAVSTIEVTGGLGGGFSAACVETGQEIRFERQIPLGSTVIVDLRTGQALIDNQSPVTGFLTRREWWTIPPAGIRTIQFNPIGAVTGTPTLTARTRPTFN